jgi:F0F1-type ATP synthase membrane subunit b/b'
MAHNKHQVAESLRRMAVMFSDMTAAADALEQIGSIEQTVAEATNARVAAELERDVAQSEVTKLNDHIAELKGQIEQLIADANAQAAQIIEDANVRASFIEDDAQDRAKALVDSGNAQASEALSNISTQVGDLQERLTGLNEAITEASRRQAEADAYATAAEQRLAKVQSAIQKLAGVSPVAETTGA